MDRNLRVAIVGLGKMGLLHASILNVLPNVQLAAMCEKSSVTRRLWKKVFREIQIVDNLEKLSDLDLDAVYVTTPIPSHFFIAKTLYTRHLTHNLFVEKTLASNYDEAKELCGLTRRFGGANMVGYLRRFTVTFRKAKDLLSEDYAGDATGFTGYAYSSDFYGMNRGSKTLVSRGGVLRDLGCHVIDLAIWFFGDLKVDSANVESVADGCSGDVWHFAVRKPGGLKGDFKASWCMNGYRMPEIALQISCSKGIIEVSDDVVKLQLNNGQLSTWHRHDLNDTSFFWLGGPEYFREDDYFIKSVRENLHAEPDFDMASKVDRLIDEVQFKVDKISD
ncbi:MAG: Gfo/Idh/MocA family oxidoreductase [Candidatus Bathyarchaeota archaeon]|nr:Gfo/Idh/MocA family oxidoreductase [Candidatus Bathyarchaeota archaeon]MDH5788529.1 Gfo/Idh/MocA family oxidoreductase [Candidatus Bathyarchaeota archaeon]